MDKQSQNIDFQEVQKAGEHRKTLSKVIIYFFLTLWALIVLFPFYWMVLTSFKSYASYNAEVVPTFFTLSPTWENYVNAFTTVPLGRYLLNTLIFTLATTAIMIVVITLAAYAFARLSFRGKNALFTLFLSLMMIPTELVMITNFATITNLELRNTFWGLILPTAVSTTNMIIMRTYFNSTIPEDLREAAFLDGCSYTKYFLRIVIPLSAPILAVIALYYAVGSWNTYFNALVYLRSSEKANLQLVLRDILLANQVNSGDGSYAENSKLGVTIKYAVIVAGCIPMLIIYPFVQRYFTKGVMIGSIKG